MTNILVVLGSVREKRVGDAILPFVTDEIAAHDDAEVTVADFKELPLPLIDTPISPAAPEFAPTDPNVQKWTQLVAETDGVVFLTPEYNHALTPVQKNALDWVKKEWEGKKVALVGYGWAGGVFALEDAHRVLEYLGAKPEPTVTQLFFTKQLGPDGSIIDEAAIRSAVKQTIDELFAVL